MTNNEISQKITLIVFVLAIIGAVVVYLQYRQVLDYAKKPINIVQETIFTVPAGTGRVALEGLLIKENSLKKVIIFSFCSKRAQNWRSSKQELTDYSQT